MLGIGDEMESVNKEIEEIKEKKYRLVFESYPSEEEKKKIRTTNIDLKKTDFKVINNMEKLLMDLPKEKVEEILKKFNNISENKKEE